MTNQINNTSSLMEIIHKCSKQLNNTILDVFRLL